MNTNRDIFLLLGSNLGDRRSHLQTCHKLIAETIGPILDRSSVYETAAWGKSDEPNYLNQALKVTFDHGPQDLLRRCLWIENKIGRVRTEKWGSRAIDIDIIYFDSEIIDAKDLKIPHPRMAYRKFVLAPLAEISPNFLHPVLQKTNAALLRDCTDQLLVKIIEPKSSS